ncbi:MAG: amidohydrolase family protein [Ignavibacteriales bacterium]|nr:MAG: amidohydrolase family protein [Ignavibacteriales bacterium]
MKQLFFLFLAFLLLISQALPQQKVTAWKGARIYTVEGNVIENGVILSKGGIITAVGSAESVSIPSDAEVIDVEGRVIIPGLVDTHSHIGNGDGGDASSPTHPDVRILDSIDPRSDTFMRARSGGITTVNVMPGSGHLLSGQTVYLKLTRTGKLQDMLYCDDPMTGICGGIKMANGTNSLRGAPFPGTRGKSASIVRQLFVKAQEYKKKVDAAGGNPEKMPKRDLEMESLVQVLEGKKIVHHHTHRNDDILSVIRLQKEFGFKVVLHHVTEGWVVAEEIAKAGIPCSIIMIDSPGGKMETVNLAFENGALLEKAGVDVAYHTDDYITDSRHFLRSAALGVRGGMSFDKALESLTLAGARMLGLENRIGSLKTGKDADFVILSGEPFSVYTKVEQTIVSGEVVFDRSRPDDYKYATGGYRVYKDLFYDHVHEEER